MKNLISGFAGKKLPSAVKLFTVLTLICVITNIGKSNITGDPVVTDSDLTLKQALENITVPDSIKKNLTLVDVWYFSFDKRLHKGQLVIRKELANDIKEIFNEIENSHYPVNKVIPIVKYNWNDDSSMADNNTSAFNYRVIKGTKVISFHAKGQAIDINPFLNPQVKRGVVSPAGAVYDASKPGTIKINSVVYKAFIKRGWQWGGNWHSLKDYQHFEKADLNNDNINIKGNTTLPFKSSIHKLKKLNSMH